MMIDEDKLLKMFEEIHGDSGNCEQRIIFDDYDCYKPVGVGLFKDGNLCWEQSIAEIVFCYITKDWS